MWASAPLVVPSRVEMDAIDRLVVAANVVVQAAQGRSKAGFLIVVHSEGCAG
jgi:hypothetical protein